jgi:hypothetical protein
MRIAPGIFSMGQEEGGHVHAFLLDDGNGLTLIDTMYDDDGGHVLAELKTIGRAPADIKHIILTHAHRRPTRGDSRECDPAQAAGGLQAAAGAGAGAWQAHAL